MIRTNRIEIRTPEGIAFSFELADPVARAAALALDVAFQQAALMALSMVLSFFVLLSFGAALAIILFAYFAIPVSYAMIFEWFWHGQTPGKRLLHLRVLDASGLRLSLHQVILRNILRPVDSLPGLYLVGGIAALVSARGQRLGDLAAGTMVVREARIPQPDLDLVLAAKHNSLRAWPHLVARFRRRVSPALADLGLRALARRATLEPEARVRIFSEIAVLLRSLQEWPQEAAEGLSDEQFVRDAVDVLYRTR